jgi:hypothetical protein
MKLRHCRYVGASGGCSSLDHPNYINKLQCLWNCGFYSNQTQTFLSLLILQRDYNIVPDEIDYQWGFRRITPQQPSTDLYKNFFRTDVTKTVSIGKEVVIPDENRKQFDLYDWELYNQIIDRFFNPSDVIASRKKSLLRNYFEVNNIKLQNTISVLYRGTDKYTEVRLAPPEDYLKVVNHLLEETNANHVLIQTDDGKVSDFFKSELGDKVITFSEPKVSYNNASVLDNLEATLPATNMNGILEHQLWFDAALRIVSECGYLVNHTGNCGLWANLYRGNTENVFQFDQRGLLT